MHAVCEPLAEMWTQNHHGECNQEHQANQQGKGHGERTSFPERASLFGIVSNIESFDRGCKSARRILDWAEIDPRRQIIAQTEEDIVVKLHEARLNEI
jgi:hypothetical protein